MSDLEERPWFIFELPGSIAFVPAESEEAARLVLARESYKDAPVDAWPCIGSRFTSRTLLYASLLRPR